MLRGATCDLRVRAISRRVDCRQLMQWTPSGMPLASRRFYSLRPSGKTDTMAAMRRGLSCSLALAAAGPQQQLHALHQMRFNATGAAAEGAAKASADATQKPAAEGDAAKGAADGAKAAEGAAEEKKPESVLSSFSKLRQDFTTFPDIYNPVNMTNMFFFTVFCLCSTGTEAESHFWLGQWGIDRDFRPLAWVLHALLANNFLTMTFAMMLFHSLGHATMAQLGPRRFAAFLGITVALSGFLMWATAYVRDYNVEKQFGPWDAIAALMVMQYLAVGTTPWGLLLSYSGWVKYANLVGGVCIIYYDPQPLLWGTLIGLALTKGKIFPPMAPKV